MKKKKRSNISENLIVAYSFARIVSPPWFTTNDIAAALKCPPRSARRYVEQLSDEGLVIRSETYPRRTYKFNKKSKLPEDWALALEAYGRTPKRAK